MNEREYNLLDSNITMTWKNQLLQHRPNLLLSLQQSHLINYDEDCHCLTDWPSARRVAVRVISRVAVQHGLSAHTAPTPPGYVAYVRH